MSPRVPAAALAAWLLVAVYYFYQYALRSAPSVMMPQLSEAFGANALGVAAIVGAFLAGMALSETVERRVAELTQGVTELLVPFFLVGIGLHFEVSAFATRSTLELATLIVLGAVISKLTACGLGALKMGRADAFRVGVGMIPRGEVGMIVAQIGMGMGVMAPNIYGIIVFMSVVTTLVAPPLLKVAFRGATPADDEAVRPL